MVFIRAVFVEVRPRIRCCNFFLTFDRADGLDLKLNIRADAILLFYETTEGSHIRCEVESNRKFSTSSLESTSDGSVTDEDLYDVLKVINMDKFCRLIPNSISGLKVENSSVFFRVLVEPTCGEFFTEFVVNQNIHNERSAQKLDISVTKNENVTIACKNCHNAITVNSVRFKRVLELPSGNIDISEWFCHKHGDENGQSGETPNLSPEQYDLFYGLCFVVLNGEILSAKFKKFNDHRNVYHCNRCLAWIGVKDQTSSKLWNSSVEILNEHDESRPIFNRSEGDSTATGDFIFTVCRLIYESGVGLQYSITCKILLQCQHSQTDIKFLLLWIIEKDLQTLQKTLEQSDDDESESLHLESRSSCKLLYSLEDGETELVKTWQNDAFVTVAAISKDMFTNGFDHLRLMSTCIPESYRVSNGFSLTYLFYDT